jgi:hypothetical protein
MMVDGKSVVQEVQKELLAALHRGHEQVRKGQDRVRQGQEQVRKGRDAVAGVVRVGTKLAKSARPSVPTQPTVHIPSPAELRKHAQELTQHAITAQRGLAGKAWQAASPYAGRIVTAQRGLADRAKQAGIVEQVATAQRTLAGRVAEAAKVATPFVAEGRTRLTHLVGALQSGHQTATEPQDKLADVPSTAAKPTAAEPTAARSAAAKPTATKSTAAKSTAASADKPAKAAATSAKPKAGTTKSGASQSVRGSKPRGAAKK